MQSSPPENRAKNVPMQGTSSQRIGAVMSRTNSHDSTPKMGRSHKVIFSMQIFDRFPRLLFKIDSENPSLLQQMGEEINSTMAGRVVSNMAKMATHKMSELLGKYIHYHFHLHVFTLSSIIIGQFSSNTFTSSCQSTTTISIS